MAIHIIETNSREAAAKCTDVLMRSGFTWLIWSLGEEGFKMTPAGSHEAASIRKFWAETIAGEFIHPVKQHILAYAMSAARKRQAQRSSSRTPERRAWEAGYKREQRAKLRAAA